MQNGGTVARVKGKQNSLGDIFATAWNKGVEESQVSDKVFFKIFKMRIILIRKYTGHHYIGDYTSISSCYL